MAQGINDGFNNQQALAFLTRNDVYNRWGNVIGSYLMLPGLRGFWPGSGVGPGADTLATVANLGDLVAGNHLSDGGTRPQFDYENLIPFVTYDGSTDRHFISDASSQNGFDILGSENYIVNQGLTIGCWFRNNGSTSSRVMSKGETTANNRAYWIRTGGSATSLAFGVSSNGTDTYEAISTITDGQWVFLAGRFDTSTEVKFYTYDVDGKRTASNTTSIPAAINNSTGNFAIAGQGDGTQKTAGDICLSFVSAMMLSDSYLDALFEQTKVLFGIV